jgi:uncharacterized protein (DUF58 family)
VNLDLARLNHILIPQTKEERDKLRASRFGRAMRPLARLHAATTKDGQLFASLSFLALVFGLDARRTEAHLLFALLFAAVLASVLVSRRFRLEGGKLEVAAPRQVALGEAVRFTLRASASRRPTGLLFVRRPFLPYDGEWVTPSDALAEVGPSGEGRIELGARFRRRGHHHLDPFGAGVLVPFGLAVGPLVESAGVRFVVVPRLANVAGLELPLGRRCQPGGVALASKTGDSAEFLGLRPYRPGDPVRDLHAPSSARAGMPVVRDRQEEYFSRVAVVLDAGLAGAGSRSFEAALSLTAGVIAHVTRGESIVDLVVAGDRLHGLRLGRSLGHLEQALDLLACVSPGGALVAAALLGHLDLPHLSSLVLVTSSFGEAHRRLTAAVKGSGVGCRILLVGEGERGEATRVPLAAIERGEALFL